MFQVKDFLEYVEKKQGDKIKIFKTVDTGKSYLNSNHFFCINEKTIRNLNTKI